MGNYTYKYDKEIDKIKLQKLFKSVEWKSAEYPNRLYEAIKNSSYVMTVWDNEELIGLISAISDGYINVFITYLLVSPNYQNKGLGKIMMSDFCKKYQGFGRKMFERSWTVEQNALVLRRIYRHHGVFGTGFGVALDRRNYGHGKSCRLRCRFRKRPLRP